MNASDLIDGRYRLERVLGTGGTSEVWLAEDERLGRRVAVKALQGRDAELAVALEREARLVANLQHPNIAAVYDAGRHEGQHYLVAEYVDGHSVREMIENRGRLPEDEAVRYGVQIAQALQYAHEHGVIHCDIKPENILVTENGVAKAVDFGVAETITRTMTAEQARDILGTVAYLAPEVIQGSAADAKSDVYSLGVTVFEMVAGRLPFPGTSAAALAGQRLAAPAPALRTFAHDASPGLERVLQRALALSPQDRHASAEEFAQDLSRASTGRRDAAPPPPPTAASAAPGRVIRRPTRPTAAAPPPRSAPARSRRDTARIRRAPGARRENSAAALVVVGLFLLAAAAAIPAAFFLLNDDNDGGGGTATPTPTVTEVESPTAEPTAAPTDAPTATESPAPTETPTETATPTGATPTPTEEEATPTPTPEATATPTEAEGNPTPTPEE